MLRALGVDARAIRDRRLYLPWEAGKMPGFALEMASESAAENDIGDKREIYERLGVGEYWRLDASGGGYYGEPLAAEQLVNGRYRPRELAQEADGSLRGYSPVLDLILSWERQEDGNGWLCLYDPAKGQRLESYDAVTAARLAAEAEARELREQLRRLRGQ